MFAAVDPAVGADLGSPLGVVGNSFPDDGLGPV